MTIKFLHTPIEQIDQLCKEEDCVKIIVQVYHNQKYDDGKSQLVQTCERGQTIKSSKDLIQFDDEDMKKLSREPKLSMR